MTTPVNTSALNVGGGYTPMMNWGQMPAIVLPQEQYGIGFDTGPNNYLDTMQQYGLDTSVGATGGTTTSPGFTGMQKMWGGTNAAGESTMGWGTAGLKVGQTLLNGYLGLQSLGVAKDQLDFQKKAFNMNYQSQKQATNRQLRDRQMRRQHERPDYYQSVGEYMNKNGVK